MSEDIISIPQEEDDQPPKKMDWIERFAKRLPPDVRADFLMDMRHMQSLSRNDELLIVLNSLGYVTQITVQVPEEMMAERERFECLSAKFTEAARELSAEGKDCYRDLVRRLWEQKDEILKTIDPSAIAVLVAKDIERHFKLTTIPAVALKLAEDAKKIEDAEKKFGRSSTQLCDTLSSAAANASKAAEEMDSSSARAVQVINQGIDSFLEKFGKNYRRNMITNCTIFSILAFSLGMSAMPLFKLYTSRKTHTAEPAPVQYMQPLSQPPTAKSAAKRNR